MMNHTHHDPIPRTLDELAIKVRALRKAQNHAYYEYDPSRKYQLQETALRLGREMDAILRILEIHDLVQHPRPSEDNPRSPEGYPGKSA